MGLGDTGTPGRGTWDVGRGDAGTQGRGDAGTRGRGDAGLGGAWTWGAGTPGRGTRDSKSLRVGDVGRRGLEDVINKQHMLVD